MEVTCPNCGARYRLKQAVAPGVRMRCAACDYRWAPVEALADTPAETTDPVPDDAPLWTPAPTPPEPPPPEPVAEPPPAPATVYTDTDDEPEEPRRSRWFVTLIAVLASIILSLVAAGLWIGDRAPELLRQLPVVGDLLARPAATPLKISVSGIVSTLPGDRRLLEVSGTLANPSTAAVRVPPLEASLSGPNGVALRWIIAPPVATLPPGHSVAYASAVTGFPADATGLAVTAGR